MIVIDNTRISDDIKERQFVCHLEKCKGACCVEGDLGAPLEQSELNELERLFPVVKPYLSQAGAEAIEKQGAYILDEEGEYSTTTVNRKECAFAVYDQNWILKCGIELAYQDGKTDFQKPLSCHLYPIRVKRYEHYNALNYDHWSICSDACTLGASLGVRVFEFLKQPLIRRFGEDWYTKLVKEIGAG